MKNVLIYAIIAIFVITLISCGKGKDDKSDIPELNTKIPATTTTTTDDGTVNIGYRGRVCALEMNFRTKPSADEARVKGYEVIYWGTEFDIISEEGDWVQVRLDDGTEGWLLRRYENKMYISDNDEATYSMIPGRRPMDSDQFLVLANGAARDWDKNASLSLLCGDGGGLDGKCYSWIAIYRSPNKPGKKLMCGNSGKDFAGFVTDFIADEWNDDWLLPGRSDLEGVAPGPMWVAYRNYAEPGRFISTSALCSYKNISSIVNRDYAEHPGGTNSIADFRKLIETEGELVFVLNGDKWEIRLGGMYAGYMIYQYDAATGNFISFNDETF